ncbi:hypothetical protein LVY72_10920 [Arthrobacter sp. I2-34]|uniref:Uncharacterized protein n=1 Tax=Arthrobacter hankyongi TaxID=2904801 RepID=A0ABS9L7G7_9MICC|nr:hypothetical protein [Arthrobacter hankyongi]MCG2622424.1 hypothetical protein [Arthrobacter hankyongi]
MAMVIGTVDADAGLSKAIFEQMDRLLAPPLQQAVDAATGDAKTKAQEALDAARKGWKQLAFAIATGVVTHLTANMEITGIQTSGDIAATVAGQTAAAPPGPHLHEVNLTGAQRGATFTQSGTGLGHVK